MKRKVLLLGDPALYEVSSAVTRIGTLPMRIKRQVDSSADWLILPAGG